MRRTLWLTLALLATVVLAAPSSRHDIPEAASPVMRAIRVDAPKCDAEGIHVCRVIVESTPVEISMISSTISYREPVSLRVDPNGVHMRDPEEQAVECVSFLAGGTGTLRSASHFRTSEMGDAKVLLGTWLFEKNMLPATPHHNTVLQLAYSGAAELEVPIHLITRSGVRYSETVTCSAGSTLARAGLRTVSSMPTFTTVGLLFLGIVVASVVLRICCRRAAHRKQPVSIRMLPLVMPTRKDYDV